MALKPSSVFSSLIFTNLVNLISPSISIPISSQTFSSSSEAMSPSEETKAEFSPFKPSMAVVVGALTTTFSITFLVLLYARHCKRRSSASEQPYFPTARKHSGVDRAVVQSLPVFRFGGHRPREGPLECAVCLFRFEQSEVLRLLPKCRHAFHVECVDTWLDAHSTCPLCRLRVDHEDILLVFDTRQNYNQNQNQNQSGNESHAAPAPAWFRRVSGRHSSAGERRRAFQLMDTASFRRSLDSWKRLKNSNINDTGNKTELVAPRKDQTLMERRNQRWSDVQPSDLVSLQSEMIMNDVSRGLYLTRGGK